MTPAEQETLERLQARIAELEEKLLIENNLVEENKQCLDWVRKRDAENATLRADVERYALTITDYQDSIVNYRKRIAELEAAGIAATKHGIALEQALHFYAEPENYFGIGIFADPPCGEFADDFEELSGEWGHPDGGSWVKPGKRARAVLYPKKEESEMTPEENVFNSPHLERKLEHD
jgi:hypothetical protein